MVTVKFHFKYNGFAPYNVSNYQQQQKYKIIKKFVCFMNENKAEIQEKMNIN